jgi:hypothetical protein
MKLCYDGEAVLKAATGNRHLEADQDYRQLVAQAGNDPAPA